MSTHENKIEVITEFLRNRAALGRVTNVREIQMVAGEMLYTKEQRSHPFPVEREKVHAALDDIAKASYAAEGVLLNAVVTHFWDDEIGERATRWGVLIGVVDQDTAVPTEALKAFFLAQRAEVFAKYQNTPVIPDTPVDLG